jgi:hypothetical protein
VVGRIRFALERFASQRHSSHVAQLWSLGHFAHHDIDITSSRQSRTYHVDLLFCGVHGSLLDLRYVFHSGVWSYWVLA